MPRRTLLPVMLVLLLAAAGIGAWTAGKTVPPEVQVVRPRRAQVAAGLTAQGRVESTRETTVRARVEGLVRELRVDAGDAVTEGRELLLFDGDDARHRVEQAQNRLDLAQWESRDAERELAHSRSLVSVASESRSDLDAKVSRLEKARLQGALAEKELALARTHLAKLDCPSPHAGVVLEKLVEAGQWVPAGQPLFRVADHRRLKVAVNVDEADAPAVRLDQSCSVTADSLPGETFAARVTRVAPLARIERDATVVVVTATLTEETERLKVGNQVDVRVITRDAGEVLSVPVEAVRADRGGRFAWVAEAGVLRRRPVRLGVQNAERAEVLEGLGPQDRVVVSLGLDLADGLAVAAVERPQ
ncbi:MAG: efflux RND transporter periplasmic adaptor subunit [Planctomycetes bacterium]|nr:efflux RND transporter periplasmic adaptor subunit [Planctomycetota bacterium]